MPKITYQFDIAVADDPADLSEATRALLLITDLALLLCEASALALRAAEDAIPSCAAGANDAERPTKDLLLPNKIQSYYRLSRELLETVDTLGIPSL